MAAIFPGAGNALPGTYSEVVTLPRGAGVPGGVRLAALIGEGLRAERLVSSALGGGSDGFDETYSTTTGSDGRHFKTSLPAHTSNRTVVYKNGIPLTGLEQAFDEDTGSFSSRYDYRLNITEGWIELQTAALVDQGGSYYLAASTNVGNGTISGLTLLDENAPTETWTIRCTSIRRDGDGNPVDGYAKFVAQGSVSGILLDGYGNAVVWQSNDIVNNNTILQFSIDDGSSKFEEGDRFTVKVRSGALSRGDSLTVHYIPETDLNDPEFFTDPDALNAKHGAASLTNRLSLGAQLAFANGPPGIWTLQSAPSVPRRVSYTLEASASGSSALDDLMFSLPLGVVPDAETNINFFVTDPVTDTETQLIPNKVAFYNSTFTASPAAFTTSPSYEYSYTVILEDSVQKEGDDGVLVPLTSTTATLSSATVDFGLDDLSGTRSIKILTPASNAGVFTVVSVANGVVTISRSSGTFTSASSLEFQVVDSADTSARILFTEDLALSTGKSLRATVVDTRDADFFDPGWVSALEALEAIECDIVVPLPSQTISTIMQQTRIHCENMSQIKNRKERVLFTGAIQGLTPDHVTGVESAAVEDIGILEGIQGDDVSEILAGTTEDLTDYSVPTAYGNTFRVVYFYPDEIVVQIGGDRVAVDGFFIAAAAAGYLSGVNNVAIPLTNKTLAGFTILRDKLFRPIVLENLAVAGITVLQPTIGGGKVIWGKTTTNSLVAEEEEISIVFIRDRIAKNMRTAMASFVGTAETPTLQGSLMARANAALQGFVAQGLITAYRDVKVVRNAVEPRQFDISANVSPAYPCNWIFVRVGIGLL